MVGTGRWQAYVQQFHEERAGITEQVLRRCSGPAVGPGPQTERVPTDPYRWLARRVSPGSRVLDLACGSAPLHAELCDVERYIGVDASPDELRLATRRGARVVLADATRLPLGDATVDVVLCSMSLMLLPVPTALAEVGRVLRPGGRFAAMVPTSAPITLKDRYLYARLLFALRTTGFRYPHGRDVEALRLGLTIGGLRVVEDVRTRFSYPLDDGAARLLLSSLYLPDLQAPTRERAQRVAERWVGGEIGIPLRLVVMTKSA